MAFICRAAARLSAALVLMIGIAAPAGVSAETIAMIGTGEVSSALGPRLASLGHEIVYGSRSPAREDVQALVAVTGTRASATSACGGGAAGGHRRDRVALRCCRRSCPQSGRSLREDYYRSDQSADRR